jgi:hypothetical protein
MLRPRSVEEMPSEILPEGWLGNATIESWFPGIYWSLIASTFQNDYRLEIHFCDKYGSVRDFSNPILKMECKSKEQLGAFYRIALADIRAGRFKTNSLLGRIL